jgi:hypothetical protein
MMLLELWPAWERAGHRPSSPLLPSVFLSMEERMLDPPKRVLLRLIHLRDASFILRLLHFSGKLSSKYSTLE